MGAGAGLLGSEMIQQVGQIVGIFDGETGLRDMMDHSGQPSPGVVHSPAIEIGSNIVSCGHSLF